jgi:hypothetical protein
MKKLLLYTEILALHRVQLSDLEKVNEVYELRILVNSTKMDLLISSISELNISIDNDKLREAYERVNVSRSRLVREKGYESGNNSKKRQRNA